MIKVLKINPVETSFLLEIDISPGLWGLFLFCFVLSCFGFGFVYFLHVLPRSENAKIKILEIFI